MSQQKITLHQHKQQLNLSKNQYFKKKCIQKNIHDVLTNLSDEYIEQKYKVTKSIASELQKNFAWNVGFQKTPVEKSTFIQTENNKK